MRWRWRPAEMVSRRQTRLRVDARSSCRKGLHSCWPSPVATRDILRRVEALGLTSLEPVELLPFY
jgi:hypothetical protein